MTFKPMTVKLEDGFIREILEFRRLEFVAGNRKAVNKTKVAPTVRMKTLDAS